MSSDLTQTTKRLLILGDHDCLAKAVAADLACLGETEVIVQAGPADPALARVYDGHDLIVLAMGLPYSEPLVALARASLAQEAGRVPILIISDRYFESDLDAHIAHLDYPCNATDLCAAARELLGAPQSCLESDAETPMTSE